MGLRKQIGNFFGFSRAQTNGFLILLPLLILILFSEPVYRWWLSTRSDQDLENGRMDSLMTHWNSAGSAIPVPADGVEILLTEFNPNTVTYDQLMDMGFSSQLANRLISYRKKGGTFQGKEDLLKLYGMDSGLYQKLLPYIAIRPRTITGKPTDNAEGPTIKTKTVFDINQADTAQLETVYGIGKILSQRIIKYREALGGFISQTQLFEVYGLDSAVVNRLVERAYVAADFSPRKININQASEDQLVAHPYISKPMARAIVTYRFQHGRYQSVEKLTNVLLISGHDFSKIKPYLAIE